MEKVRVIIINGASSSGKTTLSKELLTLLGKSWFYFSIDDWIKKNKDGFEIDQIVKDFYLHIVKSVNQGNNIIIDHVFEKKIWHDQLLEVLSGIQTVLVNLWCSKKELINREEKRKDRNIGLAMYHFSRVYKYYSDLKYNSSTMTLKDIAKNVLKYINTYEKN